VERQSAGQFVVNAGNELEKAKLTLARVTGLPDGQKFEVSDRLDYLAVTDLSEDAALAHAHELRADLRSAAASVREAEYQLQAEKAERQPTVSLRAGYGGAGVNVDAFSQIYQVDSEVSLPLYTGGRIRSDIERAQNELARRQAEYADLQGRVVYDVRVAWLDLQASDSSVKVAESNRTLAGRALTQSKDRYSNGVANYLEVLRAQEAVSVAGENYIRSLYSFNVAKLALARPMGGAENRIQDFFGGK
jgi:outer membrane protein TolC